MVKPSLVKPVPPERCQHPLSVRGGRTPASRAHWTEPHLLSPVWAQILVSDLPEGPTTWPRGGTFKSSLPAGTGTLRLGIKAKKMTRDKLFSST